MNEYLKHLNEFCLWIKREAECKACNQVVQTSNKKLEINQHIAVCSEVEIECAERECPVKSKRKYMKSHTQKNANI